MICHSFVSGFSHSILCLRDLSISLVLSEATVILYVKLIKSFISQGEDFYLNPLKHLTFTISWQMLSKILWINILLHVPQSNTSSQIFFLPSCITTLTYSLYFSSINYHCHILQVSYSFANILYHDEYLFICFQ